MKTLRNTMLLTMAATGISQAAVVISVNNFANLSTGLLAVVDNGANPSTALASGSRSWSVGYFDNPTVVGDETAGYNFSGATLADLKSHFVIFGTTSTTFTTNGLFNSSRSVSLPANDATYTGKTIYTLIGNAGTVAGSSAFAILASGTKFPVVDASGNGAASNLTQTPSTIVWGTELTNAVGQPAQFTNPSGGSFTKAVELSATAPVPEPSAALLGALGVLGLLRRRRN